jgi:valyl-tRNA synthetase
MNLTIGKNELPEKLELEDKWILSKLNSLAKEVNENIDKFELGIAANKIYDFIWDNYCDWYIELTKPRLNGEDEEAKIGAQKVLLYVLTETLKLLHPFMPFITEEIWQALPHEGEALMIENYPEFNEAIDFPEDEAKFEIIMNAIRAVRARRAEMNVPPSKWPHLTIVTSKKDVFKAGLTYLSKLAFAGEVTITGTQPDVMEGLVGVITNDAKLYMPLAELVDIEKERERIQKELKTAAENLRRTESKLSNQGFLAKAPEEVVTAEKERAEKLRALIENLEDSLKALN